MRYVRSGATFKASITGAPTGLLGVLGVRISDSIQQTDVVARNTSNISEYPVGSGTYTAVLDAPSTTGNYLIVWDDGQTFVSEELVVTPSGVAPGWSTGAHDYPSAEELVAMSNLPELTELGEEDHNSLRESAIVAIEEFCGQSFRFFANETRTADGTGDTTLYLPDRAAVVYSVEMDYSGLHRDDLILSERGDRLTVKPTAGIGNYYVRAMRDIEGYVPPVFPFGSDNVKIRADWGWVTPPEGVIRAIVKDMEDTALADANALNPTIRAFRKMGLADISQGDLRATIGRSFGLSDEVMTLLKPYIWSGPIGARA